MIMALEQDYSEMANAKDSPRKREKGVLADVVQRHVAVGAVGVSLLLLVIFLARSLDAHLRGTVDHLRPPEPYRYKTFMDWLRTTDFTQSHLSWRPEVAEFDIDAAAQGSKFAPWLDTRDGNTRWPMIAAKAVNKYAFMQEIMQEGEERLTTIGGPGTHVYVLKQLWQAASDSRQPTFLDAGCGPGVLLLAWTLMTGKGSRAIGIDVDEAVVAAAQKHLADPDAFDTSLVTRYADSSTEVYLGNALKPDVQKIGVRAGTVDAINVGLSVAGPGELDSLVELLRPGGLMIAPVCETLKSGDAFNGRCDGFLQVLQKGTDGILRRVAGDPDIPCRFIIGQHQRRLRESMVPGRLAS